MGRSLLIFSDVTFKMAAWQPYWIFVCRRHGPERNSSLLWNFNFKFHVQVVSGHRQKPIDFQRRHFQNGRLVAILDFFSSRSLSLSSTLNILRLEYQIQILHAWYLWLWVEAYRFWAILVTKWSPGSHIGFFGFRTLTLGWFWISTPNFNSTLLVSMGRSLLIFSDVTFKMAAWRPFWFF